MLDAVTRKNIDDARNMLVGKVPDPKSQVEQITLALIYKFMDDMDTEAAELGGRRKFFAGDYAQYAWSQLMSPALGGHELVRLYDEGISKMPENAGIPLLFRDIFKNAYLPYRDPETLKKFLKIINEFKYDHSERLGDAFEYLLSVLGSQGDAGQFRTPRHIIDFMVQVIDPKKDEVILDPACGTAGFLISSYKHILRANTDDKGRLTLTPAQRGKLAQNFKGYDISPDMVRLSLVNMYLHGFPEPHIHEYDTLTSEERWAEYADVILANPPFMSPTGGIKPHKRFSIQAKRSEVLFVDYMYEHLTARGRAAIIVPEGIIFQSQRAYKELRKLLVDNALVAVVSLPAGVFNPYSGVKTSIMILDKALGARSGHVAFFKVENDGFGLGAQRREIEANDLPQVQRELAQYLDCLRAGGDVEALELGCGQVVTKERIAANGDYNLSGERHKEGVARATRYPIHSLGEVAEVVAGQSPPGESYNETGLGVPFYQGKTEFGEMFIGPPTTWTTEPQRFAEPGDILMSVRAPVGPVNLTTQRMCIGRGLAAIKPTDGKLMSSYAFYFLRSQETHIKGDAGAVFASINRGQIEQLQIPLPPLEVQKEIVAEIEGYQKVINGARAVLDNYRPQIAIDPEWPVVELGEICNLKNGYAFKSNDYIALSSTLNIRMSNIRPGGRFDATYHPKYLPDDYATKYAEFLLEDGDIVVAMTDMANDPKILGVPAIVRKEDNQSFLLNQRVGKLYGFDTDKISIPFVQYLISSEKVRQYYKGLGGGGLQINISKRDILSVKIPLPPISTQQSIVAEIEAEQALVNANRELIERFEKKIQAVLARVWGDSTSNA